MCRFCSSAWKDHIFGPKKKIKFCFKSTILTGLRVRVKTFCLLNLTNTVKCVCVFKSERLQQTEKKLVSSKETYFTYKRSFLPQLLRLFMWLASEKEQKNVIPKSQQYRPALRLDTPVSFHWLLNV